MLKLDFLKIYSGQTAQELLNLEGEYRTDSLVLAFERAIAQKLEREDVVAMNIPEWVVLATKALEREVMNGGFAQFFTNSSVQYTPVIIDALKRIGCPKTVANVQRAIDALELPAKTVEQLQKAMQIENDERDAKLSVCDNVSFAYEEDIAEKLFAFIRANRDSIRIP